MRSVKAHRHLAGVVHDADAEAFVALVIKNYHSVGRIDAFSDVRRVGNGGSHNYSFAVLFVYDHKPAGPDDLRRLLGFVLSVDG